MLLVLLRGDKVIEGGFKMKLNKVLIASVVTYLLFVGTSVFAADYTATDRGIVNFNETLDVSELNKHVVFEGNKYTLGDYDKYVTYRVVDENNNLHNYGQISLDETGNVSFSFRIKGATGEYTLTLSNKKLGKKTYTIDYVNNVYIEFNDVKALNDVELMDEFLMGNGLLFKFDLDAYKLLTETSKNEIIQAFIGADDVASMTELETLAESINVVDKLFVTSESTEALVTFILADVQREESLFNKKIVNVFSNVPMNDTLRNNVVAELIGSPLNESQMALFEYEVLKSRISLIEYFADMDLIILSEGNIWGFESADLADYKKSNKANVQKQMMEAINNVTNLAEYRDKFGEIVDDNPKQPSGGIGGGGGGGGGAISKPSVETDSHSLFGNNLLENSVEIKSDLPPRETRVQFKDLSGFEWAKEAIDSLVENYIVNGVSKDEFQPSRTIRREEFVKMITSGLRLTGAEAESTFDDVSKDEWYYSAIAAAERAEIVKGNESGYFGIGAEITREDAVVILSRAADFSKVTLEKTVDVTFADNDNISGYAKSDVKKLSQAGIINGMGDGNFMPKSPLTRAEAAKMIYVLFKAIAVIQ